MLPYQGETNAQWIALVGRENFGNMYRCSSIRRYTAAHTSRRCLFSLPCYPCHSPSTLLKRCSAIKMKRQTQQRSNLSEYHCENKRTQLNSSREKSQPIRLRPVAMLLWPVNANRYATSTPRLNLRLVIWMLNVLHSDSALGCRSRRFATKAVATETWDPELIHVYECLRTSTNTSMRVYIGLQIYLCNAAQSLRKTSHT